MGKQDKKPIRKGKVVVSKKTKKWFAIKAPSVFESKEIGHTLALDEKMIVGRLVTITMNNLTGVFHDYDTNVVLKITNVKGGSAQTEYAGQKLMEDKVARLVNKWSSRIDNIFDIETKDGRLVRVKLLTISVDRVKVNLKKAIRAKVEESTKKLLENKSLDEIVTSFIDKKFKQAIKSQTQKLYPLKTVEIRRIEVLK
jgi:small subunit ribosomal protein S3Ae